MAVVLQGSQKKDGIAAANSVSNSLYTGCLILYFVTDRKKELQRRASYPAECS